MGISVKISLDQEELPDVLKPRAISNESGNWKLPGKITVVKETHEITISFSLLSMRPNQINGLINQMLR